MVTARMAMEDFDGDDKHGTSSSVSEMQSRRRESQAMTTVPVEDSGEVVGDCGSLWQERRQPKRSSEELQWPEMGRRFAAARASWK